MSSRGRASAGRQAAPGQAVKPGRIPLLLLGQGLFGLRALRLSHPAGSLGEEAIVTSERMLLVEIREQYGEEASMLASDYPYLDHRP